MPSLLPPALRASTGPHRGLLVLLLAAACDPDTGVKVYHEPPVVAIFEPAESSSFYEDQLVTFKAQIETLDGDDVTNITHMWVAGSTTICPEAATPADGIALCTTSFGDAGDYAVTVSASNPQGDRATDDVSITIAYNEPPTVELVTPVNGATLQSKDLVVFEAVIGDTEDEADQLSVEVSSNVDGVLGLPPGGATSGAYSGATYLSGGTHLLTITVTDSAGKTGQDTATVKVNDPPAPPTVDITPAAPGSGEALAATVVSAAVDPEGDPVTYRYDWYADGALYSSSTVPAVPSGITLRGEYWEVYVYPYDGAAYGNPGTDAVTIGNTLPEIDSVVLDPNPAYTDDSLTATPVGWYDPEGDSEDYTYEWYLNGTLDTSQTTNLYPYSLTKRGDTVRCDVTPSDAYGDGVTVSSSTLTIQNSLPTAPGVAISPSAPEPGDALVCTVSSASTDVDGDKITYSYEWYENGVLTANTTYLVAAGSTVHGDTWECRVTPSDGVGTGTYGTATVSVNDGTAPDAPTIDSLDAYTNDDEVELTGTCESGCALTFSFKDSTGSWTEKDTCDSGGTYSYTTYVTRGYTTSITATCTDSAGNTSANSNTVSTQACDPYDTYENSSGYGDTGTAAIDLWSTLSDAGTTTITITGNALDSSDEDWYVISTSDSYAADVSAGQNKYNFEVALTNGSGTYSFLVYDTTPDATSMVCSAYSASGYQEFDYYQQDLGEGVHAVPSNTKACAGAGSSSYNECTDFSGDWYIKVFRNKSASASCEYYELTITNGL